jgi:putative transposase
MLRESYPSDLTDAQWRAVEPLIPPPSSGGRKREVDMREVVNAIRYLHATNCGWRCLPAEFPNRSTVRHYYDVWRAAGVWKEIEAAMASASPPASADCPDDEGPLKPHDRTS